MSYIQFESAREKEKIRQELRDAREQLLEKAKKDAEKRDQRKLQEELRGEKDWMLPSVAAKIEQSSQCKVKKFKEKISTKKKPKKSKDSKKKKKKKHRRRSSSSSEQSDESEDETSSSSADSSEEKKRKVPKKNKKRRSKNKRRQPNEQSSDSDSSEETGNEQQWVERPTAQPAEDAVQRDSWMTDDSLLLKTFKRDRPDPKKPNERQQQIDAYDPATSVRELNPYWKSTGTGLPAFQKPCDDAEGVHHNKLRPQASGGWRKKGKDEASDSGKYRQLAPTSSSSRSSEGSDTEVEKQRPAQAAISEMASEVLTDEQMNVLGAKIVKAEIMGNLTLAADLTLKLEQARTTRLDIKKKRAQQTLKPAKGSIEKEEHLLLTRTDERGNCRPLAQSRPAALDPRDLYGKRSGSKKKHQRVETHADGERVRYFPDDDKYNIKQMFEREKYATTADSNRQFAEIAGKHKNPNDDLEDIFADKIRQGGDEQNGDTKELQRAINEEQRMSERLVNCVRCLDSSRIDKRLLIALGNKAYLALSSHVGLQEGHCVIVSTQHISCCTQADEDTWEDLNNIRSALTRMFRDQQKDVIFFEIANNLQRRPHLTIHCIPVPEQEAELAPFYFKKAIEESEREWSVNRQLVSLRNNSLRSAIPKGLDYFWVHFGMDSGFAHVIEDQDRFPSHFATEIIGGLLHLEPQKWRKPHREENVIAKVKLFANSWQKYDCTSN